MKFHIKIKNFYKMYLKNIGKESPSIFNENKIKIFNLI